jgi:hypothetical protein
VELETGTEVGSVTMTAGIPVGVVRTGAAIGVVVGTTTLALVSAAVGCFVDANTGMSTGGATTGIMLLAGKRTGGIAIGAIAGDGSAATGASVELVAGPLGGKAGQPQASRSCGMVRRSSVQSSVGI